MEGEEVEMEGESTGEETTNSSSEKEYYVCSLCSVKFPSYEELILHWSSQHSSEYKLLLSVLVKPNKKDSCFPFPDRPCFKPPDPKSFYWILRKNLCQCFILSKVM
jgi:hypothetical protein